MNMEIPQDLLDRQNYDDVIEFKLDEDFEQYEGTTLVNITQVEEFDPHDDFTLVIFYSGRDMTVKETEEEISKLIEKWL